MYVVLSMEVVVWWLLAVAVASELPNGLWGTHVRRSWSSTGTVRVHAVASDHLVASVKGEVWDGTLVTEVTGHRFDKCVHEWTFNGTPPSGAPTSKP